METNEIFQSNKFKEVFIVNANSAPVTWNVFEMFKDWYIIAHTYEKISAGIDLFKNEDEFTVSKMQNLVIPAFLNDGLVIEKDGEFEATKKCIIIGGADSKYTHIKALPSLVSTISYKVHSKNIDDVKFFSSIGRQVNYEKYKKLEKELMDAAIKIFELPIEPDASKAVSYDLALISFKKLDDQVYYK